MNRNYDIAREAFVDREYCNNHNYRIERNAMDHQERCDGTKRYHIQKECQCGSIVVYIETLVHSREGNIFRANTTESKFFRRDTNAILGCPELQEEKPHEYNCHPIGITSQL